MKKQLFILPFLVLFSFSLQAEWKKIATNRNGDDFYIDDKKIKKEDNITYFWVLIDSPINAISNRSGIKSVVSHQKCDCSNFKYKTLSWMYYKGKMGTGISNSESEYDSINFVSSNYWTYPSDKSVEKKVIIKVCDLDK